MICSSVAHGGPKKAGRAKGICKPHLKEGRYWRSRWVAGPGVEGRQIFKLVVLYLYCAIILRRRYLGGRSVSIRAEV